MWPELRSNNNQALSELGPKATSFSGTRTYRLNWSGYSVSHADVLTTRFVRQFSRFHISEILASTLYRLSDCRLQHNDTTHTDCATGGLPDYERCQLIGLVLNWFASSR